MLGRWILPAYEKVISAAKAIKPKLKFIIHTDGENHKFLADLMAIGVDGITPVQPELDDPRMLKERFGRRLILWGTVSTYGMSFGSPSDVEREVEMRMDVGKEFGGLIVGPNNVIDVNTPFENLVRYHESAEKYGRL